MNSVANLVSKMMYPTMPTFELPPLVKNPDAVYEESAYYIAPTTAELGPAEFAVPRYLRESCAIDLSRSKSESDSFFLGLMMEYGYSPMMGRYFLESMDHNIRRFYSGIYPESLSSAAPNCIRSAAFFSINHYFSISEIYTSCLFRKKGFLAKFGGREVDDETFPKDCKAHLLSLMCPNEVVDRTSISANNLNLVSGSALGWLLKNNFKVVSPDEPPQVGDVVLYYSMKGKSSEVNSSHVGWVVANVDGVPWVESKWALYGSLCIAPIDVVGIGFGDSFIALRSKDRNLASSGKTIGEMGFR